MPCDPRACACYPAPRAARGTRGVASSKTPPRPAIVAGANAHGSTKTGHEVTRTGHADRSRGQVTRTSYEVTRTGHESGQVRNSLGRRQGCAWSVHMVSIGSAKKLRVAPYTRSVPDIAQHARRLAVPDALSVLDMA
eukprot:2884637-Rhodomonas_salina.1